MISKLITAYFSIALFVSDGAHAEAPTGNFAPEIIDRRTELDRQHTLSISVFSCEYSIVMLSDEGRKLDRLQYLTEALPQFSQSATFHKVEILSYHIYLNAAAQRSSAARGFEFGPAFTGYAAKGLPERVQPKCSKERTKEGGFSAEETSNLNPPIIVEISAILDGRSVSIRSVYSPTVDISSCDLKGGHCFSKERRHWVDPIAQEEINKAMDKAVGALAGA